jgi:hypothetical protein
VQNQIKRLFGPLFSGSSPDKTIEERHPHIKWCADPAFRELQRRAMAVKEYLLEHPEESARIDSRRYKPPKEGFGVRGPDARRNERTAKASPQERRLLDYAGSVTLGSDDDRWNGIEATAPVAVRAAIEAGKREHGTYSRQSLRRSGGDDQDPGSQTLDS